jgi:pSer/pThr/pTyr-binding forkhead associated (FHA) protein
MARLTLQLEDRVLKEYAIGMMTTIGRQSDNTIVIDSPAVSSHHASVFSDGGMVAVEDLQSTNGTFVNGVRVSRKTLKDGDVLQVGDHRLVFDQLADGEAPGTAGAGESIPSQGETVFIDKRTLVAKLMQSESDARKYDALLARLKDVETHGGTGPAAPQPTTPAQTAVLRVVAGRADQNVYRLESQTSLIGKTPSSLVRLRGWFKPQLALAISRNRQGYVATWLGGVVLVDNKPVNGRHELKNGDLIDVCGLLLEFNLEREAAGTTALQISH